ncbi:hypothetical protein JOL79_21570 [Microbispora sp. RL4-1S]|uniref:Uncharacterized protein n=1 Tax=Microbispora oryzae TaxID=2806554 RepID=A0A940WK21_9ACTN|nr:hypothetical protein [Microbispora oryzae]MBP2706403.1 hypothetical protein [Microbispora oryzae]
MDANSQGAADLLTALLRTAARFSEAGRAVSREFFPHVRATPIADLAGPAVRLGAELELPGHDVVLEVRVAVADGTFRVSGELTLDGADGAVSGETGLDLPLVETADAARLAALLDRYADELTAPVRRLVGALVEGGA